MLRIFNYFYLALVVGLFVSCQLSVEQKIREVIQPVKLTAGVTDTVIINDMFYAEDYAVNFLPNENVTVDYNKTENKIAFTPNMDFEGMTLISFDYDGDKFQFPVKVKKRNMHTFQLKPKEKYESLTLFGSFNGWDRKQYPMTDEDSDGVLEVSVPLEPGTYQYKYFGDGREFIDPANDVKVPNGFGDFNSILVVPERYQEKTFLHLVDYSADENVVAFKFQYERKSLTEKLEYKNIIALLDNKSIPYGQIDIDGDDITLNFDKNRIAADHTIRVTVTQDGQNTNTQYVMVKKGKPAGNKSDFSWYDGVIYSLMIDRFNDGDESINKQVQHDSLFAKANYMGGDLQGVINKLHEGYFDSLGINVLWISPVYDNPDVAYKEYPVPHRWFSGYHGYWPISPDKVEEKFGDMDKLKELINSAHQRNIHVLLDFVSNHVHEQHPFYQEHRDWFGRLELPDGRLNLRFWDEFRLTTWFEPYLPSFDYDNSNEALETMTDNAVWWLQETGADGFRHDAVKHVPNIFWRRLTQKLKQEIEIPKNTEVYQIGETFGNYELVSSYVNHGQLSAQFNFEIYNIAQATFVDPNVSFAAVQSEMEKTFSVYGNLHLMGNVMDSHDKNRFMAYADGDLDLSQWSAIEEGWNNPPEVDHPSSYNKAELYMAFMMTIPGLPVIYYGSEFGMTGASDPDNRRMMRFDDQLDKYEKGMLKEVSLITKLRNNHSALRYGDYYPLIADNNIYCYIRSDCNERLLVVLNKNSKTEQVKLTLPVVYKIQQGIDLVSGESYSIINNELNLSVDGISWKMIELK